LIVLVALLCAVTATSTTVLAQDEPTAAENGGAPDAEAPAWIPVPRIPQETERLLQRLGRFERAAKVDPEIARIAEETPGIEAAERARQSDTQAVLASVPGFHRLRDLAAEWSDHVARLSQRTRKLTARATLLEGELEQLGGNRALWARTLEHAIETDSPPDVIEAVRGNLAAIDRAGAALRDRRASVLSTLTTTGDQELRAREVLQQVEATSRTLRAQLFVSDSAPLWRMRPVADGGVALADVRASWLAEWHDFRAFLERRGVSIAPFALAFVALLIAARVVRERLHRRAASDHLEGAAGVFDRPFSVACVSLAVGVRAAMPFAPGLLYDFIGALLVLPILRVLIPIVPKPGRRVLGVTAAFYLVDRLRDLLLAAALLERLLLFVETAAAAAALLVLLRRSRLQRLGPDDHVPSAVGGALQLALVTLVAATLTNGLGYVGLGRLLGEGALDTIYLSILAYATYRIALTLVLVALTSETTRRAGAIRQHADLLARSARNLLAVGLFVSWGLGSLDAFHARDLVVDPLIAIVSTPIGLGTISVSLANLLAFPLTLAAAWLLSAGIRAVLEEDVYTRVTLQRGVGNAITSTVHYTLLLGGFLLALGAAGIDFTKFSLLAGAFGVGVGFGLQAVVNNFVSGLILLFERPIQVGDMIEIGSLLGEVKKIGIRASTIVTFQGAEVIVPNGTLLSDQLTNWTLSNRQCRLELPIGVAYGNDPEHVKAVLKTALDANPNVLPTPAPVVLFRGFGDSSLDFELRFWIPNYSVFPQVSSDVACGAHAALKAAGIEIPFPQRDLHLKSVDASITSALPPKEADE
jgi:small-conductance mechanosensitive channel